MTATVETRMSLGRRALLAMAVSMVGLGGATAAGGAVPELVDLKVVDRETGEEARVWRHAGRLYVAGRPGARYSLRVTNNSLGRVLVVMSVDGVNILTGETAAYGQRGYVLGPYGTYDVNGWRKSDREVAAFTFAPLPRSYAARTGRPGDVGVIGVAAFTEKVAMPLAVAPAPEFSARGRADEPESVVTGSRAAPPPAATAPGRAAAADETVVAERRSEKLGTGHGARERSVVASVAFERATAYPQLIRRIEYDSRENLVASGVIPPTRSPPPRPRPFPGGNGYVPDPPRG